MILQALRRLAINEQLIGDPDYEPKPVAWIVRLKPDGAFVKIEDYRRDLNEGKTDRKGKALKPKLEGIPIDVPRQPIRTSGDRAFFLVDKAEYALGADPAGKRPADKLATRLTLFREQVERCEEETGDAAVKAVVTFLRSVEQGSRPELPADVASNDQFAFKVGLDDWVHLRPAVRQWWKRQRESAGSGDGEGLRCLVSGEAIAEAGLVPLIKRVPGGSTSGVSLVSFNASAFESYGLAGNENAPISRDAAEAAATALNRLLHPNYPSPDPEHAGESLPRRHSRLSDDTVVCFWAAAKSADSWLDRLRDLLESEEGQETERLLRDEARLADLFTSPAAGARVAASQPRAFYALVLSGAQGRAVVRDWIESTVAEVDENIRQHFEDIRIVANARRKGDSNPHVWLPQRRLIGVLAPEGRGDRGLSALASDFIHAALAGQAYPFKLLQRALVRERSEIGGGEWIDAARRDARAAILKAVLNRRRRFDPAAAKRYPEVKPEMNPASTSTGYNLGVLMAVLERLQAEALGEPNASLVDRFFSAASATPRAVFVRLLKNAKHHARKARDMAEGKRRGAVIRYERLLDTLMDRFEINPKQYPPRVSGIPSHLDLEQQGLFVLGYHQMRHWLWMTREERLAWEQAYPDAPPAFRWNRPDANGGAATETEENADAEAAFEATT